LVDPAYLAESIGIDENHTVKAKITLEVVEEPCGLCGELATGDQICQKCGKLVCDKCAKTDSSGRYCPKCFGEIRSLSKLI
jgi:formylmethanofuran dehydrogenase subunit E